jgi:hypothetical protein
VPEVRCGGVDEDCDGALHPDEVDRDGDGFDGCHGDCLEGNGAVSPAAVEVCDGLDNNCDGAVDDVAGCAAACADTFDCPLERPLCMPDPASGALGCRAYCASSAECGAGEGCYVHPGSASLYFCAPFVNAQAAFGDPCGRDADCPTTYCDSVLRQCLDVCTTSSALVAAHVTCPVGSVCQARDVVHEREGRLEFHSYCVPASTIVGLVPAGGDCVTNAECATGWCDLSVPYFYLDLSLPGTCGHVCGSQRDCAPGMHCEFVDGNLPPDGTLSGIQGCAANVDGAGGNHLFADGLSCGGRPRNCVSGMCIGNAPFNGRCTSPCSSHADCTGGWRCRGAELLFNVYTEVLGPGGITGTSIWTRVCAPPSP